MQLHTHRFLHWNGNLNFTLHEKVITIHLSWRLRVGYTLKQCGC